MANKEISIVLRAKNAMAAGLSSAKESLQKVGKTALNVGKIITTGFLAGATALAGFAAKALSAYSKQEEAERRLTAALNAHGEAGEALLPMYREIASRIQDQTGVADELTLATMAQGRTLGVASKDLEDYAKGVIALKSAGLEGASAQRAMAAAMQGNTEMLTRYLPELRGVTDEQEKMRIVGEFLARGYEQQKEQLNTVGGQWNLLKGRISDVWEEVGRAIAENGALIAVLQRAGDAIKEFGQKVTDWINAGGVAASIKIIKNTLDEMRQRFQSIWDSRFDAAFAVITAAVTALIVKLVLLSQTNVALLMTTTQVTAAIKAKTLALVAKAAALHAAAAASKNLAAKILILKAGLIALSAVPIVALVAGFAAITKAAMDTNKATEQLKKSMGDLAWQEGKMQEEWGIRSPAALRKFREAMQSGDAELRRQMEQTHPKAVARWVKLHETIEDATGAVKEHKDANNDLQTSFQRIAREMAAASKAAADEAAAVQKAEQEKADAAKKAEQERIDAARRATKQLKDEHDQRIKDARDAHRQEQRAAEDAQRKRIKAAEDELKKQQDLAKMRVKDFIAAQQAERDEMKDREKEARQMQELEERVGRGVRLSRRDAERLEAFRQIEAARDQGVGAAEQELKMHQDALEQLQQEGNRKLDQVIDELKKNHQAQLDLLKMG